MSNRPTVVHGARILCYVNGKLIGRVTGFSWTSNTARKKVRVIDTLHAMELMPVQIDLTWNMELVRTIGDGGTQGTGMIAAQQPDISREKYFNLLLIERSSQLPVFRADLCNVDTESWAIRAKQLMVGNLSGSGITWINETAR